MRVPILAVSGAFVLPFVVAQSSTSVEAAVSTVSPDSTAADANLFNYETLQLLPSDLDPLNDTMTAIFGFDNTTASTSEKRSGSCKTFPGDLFWPAPALWDLFNLLLGGKLIKAVPIAAPCHNGPYYVSKRNQISIFHKSNLLQRMPPSATISSPTLPIPICSMYISDICFIARN
jgi:hypothetical protein